MKVELRESAFDPWLETNRHQASAFARPGQFGATALFIGSMRDFNDGAAVEAMHLDHYPGMTERSLRAICEQAASRHDILDVLVIHRVGEVRPSDPIVLVAVWSAHRAAAFDACRAIMEDLKSKAPFWKKEQREDGSRWVESNTPG